ncbi:MAG: ammonium transporter [Pyrobaculum sp.]
MQIDTISTIWTALGAVLVFLMIPAIGLLEAGLVRRVNVVNAMLKGLMSALIFLPIWFAVFPIYFGGVLKDGYYPTGGDMGIPSLVYAFFLGVFGAVTLALIAAGAPERLRFGGWVLFSTFFAAVQWPLVASWIWGGGFLSTLGAYFGAPELGVRDFAGGTVVHAYAGVAGFIITMILGPSLRKKMPNDGPDHVLAYKEALEYRRVEIPYAVIGTVLLFFGWFGFNGGSTLQLNSATQYALSNTAIAGSLGGFTTAVLSRIFDKIWSPVMIISGVLGGLVAITPLAGFMDTSPAYLVGILAGVMTYFGTKLVEKYYFIDDPVGSLPVHGFNGIMGSVLVPVFSQKEYAGVSGLVYGGPPLWLAVQILGMVTALVFVVATTYLVAWALYRMGYRVKREEELVGLDALDHGVERLWD